MSTRETILEELLMVERKKDVRILIAVESGSRAWGMASPDSDYDVRFVYARHEEDYLRLEDVRDTIEWKLDKTYDIVGWDLCKFLRLMRGSNPTAFEWLESPIIYREDPVFARVRDKASECFSCKASAHHYLGMAKGEEKAYSKVEAVPAKTYLYAVRAILSAQWVLDRRMPAPMEFQKLISADLDASIALAIEQLLESKAKDAEKCSVPHMTALESWIEEEHAALFERAREISTPNRTEWKGLDDLFLGIVWE